jgi:selenocysteine-specific elongation factor
MTAEKPENGSKTDESSSATAAPVTSPTSPSIKKPPKPEEVINVNVGILGHVDSGKTSLVKTLSTLLSTAALDKSKQSRQRGMTLDLGFSCFFMDLPDRLREQLKPQNTTNATTTDDDTSKLKYLQMTLVDCPGHASLIRTIIGGAQIIDVVLLVVDAYKGWQAQTTECLVLAELTAPHLVVALNKIDKFPPKEREARVKEAKAKVRERLRYSRKFSPETVPMIGVSACAGGEKVAAVASDQQGDATISNVQDLVKQQTMNVDKLIDLLKTTMPTPRRHLPSEADNWSSSTNNKTGGGGNNNFYFAIDHCFPIKGMGTVLTGTCLNGSIKVNDLIEFPSLGNLQRKIKSMQMFKRKATKIQQGDRAGICVSNFDSDSLERGVCASPGSVKWVSGAIALVRKIVPHYKGAFLKNKSKYHVSVGHSTVMATVSFWGARELLHETKRLEEAKTSSSSKGATATTYVEALSNEATACLGGDADQAGLPHLQFDWKKDYLLQDGLLESLPKDTIDTGAPSAAVATGNNSNGTSEDSRKGDESDATNQEPLLHWAILDFQTPVYCPLQSLVIGSRLDAAVEGTHRQQSKSGNKNQNKSGNKNNINNDPEGDEDDPLASSASSCRLAFCGRLIERVDPKTDVQKILWYTPKEKRGVITRLGDPHKRQDDGKVVRYEVYGGDLFKKETLLRPFLGLKLVTHPGGDIGELKSGFGTSGKFRVTFPGGTTAREGDTLRLPFKRFLHDAEKKMRQDDLVMPPSRPGSRIEPPQSKKKKVESTGSVDKVKGDPLEAPPQANGGTDKKKKAPSTKYPTAIISGLFTPDVDIRQMAGRIIWIPSTKEEGTIAGPFGKAGKCKVSFADKGISEHAVGAKAELLRNS